MKKVFMVAICCAAILYLCGCAKNNAITQEELVQRTQELVDAVAAGDQKPWQKYYADDAMYFDEKGNSADKKTLIAQTTPLPPGFSGTIKVESPWSRIEGDVAIFGYVMNETETVYGQEMHARYHEVDTWLRRNGEWKIVASQAMRYYEDPATGSIDAKSLKDFVGQYSAAEGKTITVTQDGGKLFEQKGDRPKVELIPEGSPVFFRKGVEGRTLFGRDAPGKVISLIDRRNNEDVVWNKAPAAPKK